MIKVQPAVRKETLRIAAGTLVLTVLMLAVFLILGQFDLTVLLGALLGSAAAVGNFFLLGLSVQKAAETMNGVKLPSYEEAEANLELGQELETAVTPETKLAKQRMQLSYTGRMILLAAVGVLGLTLPCFHAVATVLPFLFPRIVIFLYGIRNKKES